MKKVLAPPATPSGEVEATGSKLAISGGTLAVVGGVLLAALCCWAPALIVAMGIGSFYAAAYGYRYVLLGLGVALVGLGLFWARRKRKAAECPCGPEGALDV